MTIAVDDRITETFRALGDPVRFSMVEYLSRHGEATVTDLAGLFPISLQAVSRHIKVLEKAGVVSQHRQGRERPVALESEDVAAAVGWLTVRLARLERRYARLDTLLTELTELTDDEDNSR